MTYYFYWEKSKLKHFRNMYLTKNHRKVCATQIPNLKQALNHKLVLTKKS